MASDWRLAGVFTTLYAICQHDVLALSLVTELSPILEPMLRGYKPGTCSRFMRLDGPQLYAFLTSSLLGQSMLPYLQSSTGVCSVQIGLRVGTRRVGNSCQPVTSKPVVELELFL